MTIRRQYSLPNCTLILEGLSDSVTAVGTPIDARPLMTILVNAECHFVGEAQPLSGGREFLESLLRAVSGYAQEFLSQIPRPISDGDKPALVKLQKVEGANLHRLSLLNISEQESGAGKSSPRTMVIAPEKTVQIDLTPVQLFDLVEAVDQFLADSRTLPDLGISLQPVSRRYRQADQPIVQRAAPAALGMTSLAVAASALFLLPTPEVREPGVPETEPDSRELSSEDSEDETLSATTPKPTPTPPETLISPETANLTTTPEAGEIEQTLPSATQLRQVLEANSEIVDPTELGYLQRNLHKQLYQAWRNRRALEQNAAYQVTVGKDGAIIGYKPVKGTPIDVAQKTPLSELLYIPKTGGSSPQESYALFLAVFTKEGSLEVSPWHGFRGRPTLGKQITQATVIEDLQSKLYERINEKWDKKSTYTQDLIYRVAVTEDVEIVDYQPTNQAAWDYVKQTPIEGLLNPKAAGIGSKENGLVPQEPLAQFRVMFKPDGDLEVTSLN
ncbi:MAG: DUF4335 domain-containing protein [Symploca sp. SIO3C6]|nr:DUF4335 domain-containing protein [Symploca sp. SIO3C6]